MGAALAMSLWLQYQATLDRFLALPCWEQGYGKGKPTACSTEPGSFNRAIIDARECSGQWAGTESSGYYAVCPREETSCD